MLGNELAVFRLRKLAALILKKINRTISTIKVLPFNSVMAKALFEDFLFVLIMYTLLFQSLAVVAFI